MGDTQLVFRSPPPVRLATAAPVADSGSLLVALDELAAEFDQRRLGCPRLTDDDSVRTHVANVQAVFSSGGDKPAPRVRHREALDDLMWRRCIEQHGAAAVAALAARPATPTADLAVSAARAAPIWTVPPVAVLDTAGPACTPDPLLQKLDELVRRFEASDASFRRLTDDDSVRERLADLSRDCALGTPIHDSVCLSTSKYY